MKRRYTSLPLPQWWTDHPGAVGVLRECDIRVKLRSRLKLKVMLFRSRLAMRKSALAMLGHEIAGDLCPRTAGVVFSLREEVHSFKRGVEEVYEQFDKNYFAVMFLVFEGGIDFEYLAHEAIHAGYRYRDRVGRNVWGKRQYNGNPEELVCYPAGKIAWQLFDWALQHGLIKHRGRKVGYIEEAK